MSGQPVQACGEGRPKTKNSKVSLKFFSFAHVKKLNVIKRWTGFLAVVLLAVFPGSRTEVTNEGVSVKFITT
jgi:hypothetical protein